MTEPQLDSELRKTLDKYGTLFAKTLSIDPSDQEEATEEIEIEMNKDNRPNFIFSLAKILELSEYLEIPIIQRTIFYLSKAFSPENDEKIVSDIWKNKWSLTNDREDANLKRRNLIKNVCLDLIQYPDINVRRFAGDCLSRISIYDKGVFQDTFFTLVELFNDEKYNNEKDEYEPRGVAIESRLASLISIKQFFKYRMEYDDDDHLIAAVFDNETCFDRLIFGSAVVFINFASYNEEFLVELLEMLSCFIYIRPNKFFRKCLISTEEKKQQNQETMEKIFNGILAIVQQNSQNENILFAVHHFFYSFFEVVYDDSYFLSNKQDKDEKDQQFNDAIEELKTLFDDYIIKFNFPLILPSTNVSYIAIDFWNKIGKLEKKKCKTNEILDNYYEITDKHSLKSNAFRIYTTKDFQKYPIFYVLNQYIGKLMPMMLQSMEFIDPDGQNADDIDNPESDNNYPYSYASLVVRKFFYFNSELTFQFISDYFTQTMKQENVQWNVRHAQMQLISCVCKLNNDIIHDFIHSLSGFMVQSIYDYRDNNMVLIADLSALASAFNKYNLYMDKDDVIQLLNNITNLCTEIKSQAVVLNCIEMLKEIIGCFNNDDPDNNIIKIIELVKGFITVVSKREDFLESKYFQAFFSLKESVVEHTNPNINNEIIIEILENSYQACQQTKNMDIFIGELHVFSFIMNKYGEHFIEQGINISSRLVDMLNGPNKTITVECLTCLIQIVSGLGEKSGSIIPQLIEQINNAFQSQSPEIIVQVDSLLGSLFAKTGPIMNEFVDISVDCIQEQIKDARTGNEFAIYFSNQIHCLIIPLTKILNSIPREDPKCLEMRDKIFPIFDDVLENYRTEDKYEQVLFLESITLAFKAIVDASAADVKFLRVIKNRIFNIAAKLNKFDPLDDKVSKAYCSFIRSASEIMRPDPVLRIKLANDINLKPLVWAECSSNEDLSENAKNLLCIISPKYAKS